MPDRPDVRGTQVVRAVLDAIASRLRKGHRMALRGFGVFEPGARRARIGRNPASGEPVAIDASRFVKFRASGEIGASSPIDDAG